MSAVVCRTQGTGIEVFSLHPGSIMTNLGRHFGRIQSLGFLLKPFLKTPEQVITPHFKYLWKNVIMSQIEDRSGRALQGV